jgi:hypothetical protein
MPTPATEFPQLLRDLYKGNHRYSHHFLENIRRYNAALAFTSCEMTSDTRLGPYARYVPVSMQGETFHRAGLIAESTPPVAEARCHEMSRQLRISLIASYCPCRATYPHDDSRRSDEEENKNQKNRSKK